jgi:hypothetical protein
MPSPSFMTSTLIAVTQTLATTNSAATATASCGLSGAFVINVRVFPKYLQNSQAFRSNRRFSLTSFQHFRRQTTIQPIFLRSSIPSITSTGRMDGHTFHHRTSRTHHKVEPISANMSHLLPLMLPPPGHLIQETYQMEPLVQGLGTTTPPIGSTLNLPTLAVTTELLIFRSLVTLWPPATSTALPADTMRLSLLNTSHNHLVRILPIAS